MTIAATFLLAATGYAPETWFHVIEGNASKEGMAADIQALAEAGVGGIQFFHGGFGDTNLWPGVEEAIPCLSEKWAELVGFAADECAKRGLTFKMQNCPGWSMSGGPWIDDEHAMRKLVANESPGDGGNPSWREIGAVTFPVEEVDTNVIRSVTLPNPQRICHAWAYDPGAEFVFYDGERELMRRECPSGCWQDDAGMTFAVRFPASPKLRVMVESVHYETKSVEAKFSCVRKLDMWEAKAGWGLRTFKMSADATPVKAGREKTLYFGHVNAGAKNGPAPAEGRGWECDKMDPRGYAENFRGYLGRLLDTTLKGGKLKGTLVDSWECGKQTWAWKMEDEFRARAGYELRPWLPAIFGYVLKSEAETEKFLLDWRRICSRLIEENYFGTIARLAHENGMAVQYETAFGDVIVGDLLRAWKWADEPMCEFWCPHHEKNWDTFTFNHDFKAVKPCVSAAHVYGKPRVSAEAFTSFDLTWNENFQTMKMIANRHFARGVTHCVLHTYTHNPVVGGLPPSTSFGGHIGSPFLRLQPWWKYMPEFTKYLETCCRELERGKAAVDILMYLGDDYNHKPLEAKELFANRYKYDYLNQDALLERADAKDGRIVFPDGMSYRVLWIPKGTYLEPETETRLMALVKKGARIIRGDFTPDWEPQFESAGNLLWYERTDGGERIWFVAARDGRPFSGAVKVRDCGEFKVDLAGGESLFVFASELRAGKRDYTHGAVLKTIPLKDWNRPLATWTDGTTETAYETAFARPTGRIRLDLGKVCHWATVKVNGKVAARLWSEPYQCDVTPYLKEGANQLEVEVTAPIHNRLVLDARKPAAERTTWTLAGPDKDEKLAEAGLLGPVTLAILPLE